MDEQAATDRRLLFVEQSYWRALANTVDENREACFNAIENCRKALGGMFYQPVPPEISSTDIVVEETRKASKRPPSFVVCAKCGRSLHFTVCGDFGQGHICYSCSTKGA